MWWRAISFIVPRIHLNNGIQVTDHSLSSWRANPQQKCITITKPSSLFSPVDFQRPLTLWTRFPCSLRGHQSPSQCPVWRYLLRKLFWEGSADLQCGVFNFFQPSVIWDLNRSRSTELYKSTWSAGAPGALLCIQSSVSSLFSFCFFFFLPAPFYVFFPEEWGGGCVSCFLKRETSGHLHVKQVVACMNIYAWSFRSAHAFPCFVCKTVWIACNLE